MDEGLHKVKIFKYKIEKHGNKFFTNMPKNHSIIRMGEVHDDYYDGRFLWAIVDPNDQDFQREIDYKEWSLCPKPENFQSLDYYQLRIKEKQETDLNTGTPVYAQDVDGKLYIFFKPSYNPFMDIKDFRKYKIVFYKTGQEITEDINSLTYLGACKIFIMQELMLYTFLVKDEL